MTRSLPDASGKRSGTKRSAGQILEAAGLPDPIANLVRNLIRKTRLWPAEKADLAIELTSHFRDGLDTGVTPERLVEDFGDPAVAAKLLRRSIERNRPLWWRFLRRSVQAAGVFFLLYIAAALLLATRSPTIKVDYVAKLNEKAASATPEESAWSIYRKALIDTGYAKKEINGQPNPMQDTVERSERMYVVTEYEGRNKQTLPWPEDPQWKVFEPFARLYQPLAQAARQAADKPKYGRIAHVGPAEMPAEDRLALFGTTELSADLDAKRQKDRPHSMLGTLGAVLLPDLKHLRGMANALDYDNRLAAVEGDTDRIIANIQAMLSTARFAAEQPTLVNQLVSIGINALANASVRTVIDRGVPFSRDQLITMIHALSADRSHERIDFTAEQWLFEDMFQRMYSDDGNGDGRITLEGWDALWDFTFMGTGMQPPQPDLQTKLGRLAVLPAASILMGSRKQLSEDVDRYFTLIAAEADMPLWERLAGESESARLGEEMKLRSLLRPGQLLVSIALPVLTQAAETAQRVKADRDATLTLLALHVYKLDHGGFPESLDQLVPQYLPSMPLDHSTGGPLRYKLVDGNPVLFGLGADGDDDGGSFESVPKGERGRSLVPKEGDWVMYPEPPW